MKKTTAVMMTLLLLLSLSACGKNPNSSETGTASADDFLKWKHNTTEILCPLATGGGTDLAARVLAQALTEATGKNFIVTNNTTASGAEVYDTVSESKDCSTISFTLGSYFSGYWTGIHDFAPGEAIVPAAVLQTAGTGSAFFCVKADSPYQTFENVLTEMKAHPGTVKFGIPTGGINYFQAYELRESIDFDAKFVDAAGDSEKITGILGGTIDIGTINANQAGQYVASGDMRALIALMPYDKDKVPEALWGVPTFEEKGYKVPNCLTNYYYILASSKASASEIEQLYKLIEYVMSLDSTKEAFAKITQYPAALTIAGSKENFDASNQSYYDVAKAAGILAAGREK